MILMKGTTKQAPAEVKLLPAAKLDHTLTQADFDVDDDWVKVCNPGDAKAAAGDEDEWDEDDELAWYNKAFTDAYQLITEMEDAIDGVLCHDGNKISKNLRKRLAAVRADAEEYLNHYEAAEGEIAK